MRGLAMVATVIKTSVILCYGLQPLYGLPQEFQTEPMRRQMGTIHLWPRLHFLIPNMAILFCLTL